MISDLVQSVAGIFLVSIIWGVSNPFIKKGSEGIERVDKSSNKLLNTLYEFWFLFTRPSYVIPFAINMSGSVLFYFLLANQGLLLSI